MQRMCVGDGQFTIFDYLNKSNERVTENDRIMMNGNRVVTGGWMQVYLYQCFYVLLYQCIQKYLYLCFTVFVYLCTYVYLFTCIVVLLYTYEQLLIYSEVQVWNLKILSFMKRSQRV